jgi:hypothetical protein
MFQYFRNPLKWRTAFLPCALGFFFLYTGISKSMNSAGVEASLSAIRWPAWALEPTVVFLIGFELFLAVQLLFFPDKRFGLASAMFFLVLCSGYLTYISTFANPPNCGCAPLLEFFKSAKKNAIGGIVRNLVLIGAAALLFKMQASSAKLPEFKSGE